MQTRQDFLKFMDLYLDRYCKNCDECMIEIMRSIKNNDSIIIEIRPDRNIHGVVTSFHLNINI